MAFGSKFDMSAAEDSIEDGVSRLECRRSIWRCEIEAARDSVYSETGKRSSSPLKPGSYVKRSRSGASAILIVLDRL